MKKTHKRPFRDIVQHALSRRDVLRGGSALAAASSLPFAFRGNAQMPEMPQKIGFTPVSVTDAGGEWIAIAEEYQADIVFPWGLSLDGESTDFTWPMSPERQASSIGIGHDGMWFFPEIEESPDDGMETAESDSDPEPEPEEEDPVLERGVLCLNHEFGSNSHVLGKSAPENLSDVRVSQHAHGVSVLDIARHSDGWRFTGGCNTRRIHINTPVTFSGPAATSELIVGTEGDVPMGTLNNCGSGRTPWGTYLTCEENIQFYFGATGTVRGIPKERMGLSASNGDVYGWYQYDRRFDLSDENGSIQANRFGWVVEIDPYDVTKPPVKRTGLGRFKHESCEIVIGKDNRIVAYMGDDETFQYLYRFVSDEDYEEILARGDSPLDHGSLWVAIFNDDMTGRWRRLSNRIAGIRNRVGGEAEIAVYTRLAAEIAGGTPMDRPEWITAGADGKVYCALTNNSSRTTAGPANPQAPNPDGHIISLTPSDEHIGFRFTWDIFKLSSATHGTAGAYSDPDCIWIDPEDRLFIGTDGGQPDSMNNQLLVADAETGTVRRLFSGVPGCEITGVAPNSDQTTIFVNVQHPGNGNVETSDFPRLDEEPQVPRDATIAISRKDGGIVGS